MEAFPCSYICKSAAYMSSFSSLSALHCGSQDILWEADTTLHAPMVAVFPAPEETSQFRHGKWVWGHWWESARSSGPPARSLAGNSAPYRVLFLQEATRTIQALCWVNWPDLTSCHHPHRQLWGRSVISSHWRSHKGTSISLRPGDAIGGNRACFLYGPKILRFRPEGQTCWTGREWDQMGGAEALAVFLTLEGLGLRWELRLGWASRRNQGTSPALAGSTHAHSWQEERVFGWGNLKKLRGGWPCLCPCASTCFVRLSPRELNFCKNTANNKTRMS